MKSLFIHISGILFKTLKVLLISISLFGVGVVIFLFSSEWLWPEFYGSRNLGNGIYLMEWDEGAIIVQGSNISGRTCYGGSFIIPITASPNDSNANRKEHVVKVKYDDSWILVKTVLCNPFEVKFYVIDKDFDKNDNETIILNKHIKSFKDSIDFYSYVQRNNISVRDMQTYQTDFE
jgi:hypothetical protein